MTIQNLKILHQIMLLQFHTSTQTYVGSIEDTQFKRYQNCWS